MSKKHKKQKINLHIETGEKITHTYTQSETSHESFHKKIVEHIQKKVYNTIVFIKKLSTNTIKLTSNVSSNTKRKTVHLSHKDQIFFIKRLSFLMSANIPILESITLIRYQTKSKKFLFVLDKVIEDVSEGRRLSQSLNSFKGLLGDFAIHIIDFGEQSGTLPQNLDYLAGEMNKRHILQKKILAAFAYPGIVTIATFGITAFLILYLFPKIMPVFQSLHITLPLSTRILIFVSVYIQKHGLLLIIFIFLLFFCISIGMKRIQKFRFTFDFLILKTPIIRSIVKDYNLANSTRTLGLLLKSGTPLIDALPIAIKTATNLVYQKELDGLTPIIERGEKMSPYLELRKHLFPDIFTQIITIGERSGNLSASLLYLSQLFEEQVDEFTRNISTLVEPVLMITMGLVVGFIAISIITPIYGITQNLHP